MPNCQTYRDPSTPTRGVGVGEGVDGDGVVMCKHKGLLSDESFVTGHNYSLTRILSYYNY